MNPSPIEAGRCRCRIHSDMVVPNRFCDLLFRRCLRMAPFGLRALKVVYPLNGEDLNHEWTRIHTNRH